MSSKAKAERKHCLHRLRERFGVNLSENDYYGIINQIQNNKAKFVDRQSNRVTIWQLVIQQQDVVVCYDKIRKEIITAIPAAWYGKEERYAWN